MIKLCGDSLCIPLKFIFDTCQSTGTYPAIWKRSNVIPIHKKGSKNQIGNYFPISLLHVFSKIFEKVIFDCLYTHLKDNSLLSKH